MQREPRPRTGAVRGRFERELAARGEILHAIANWAKQPALRRVHFFVDAHRLSVLGGYRGRDRDTWLAPKRTLGVRERLPIRLHASQPIHEHDHQDQCDRFEIAVAQCYWRDESILLTAASATSPPPRTVAPMTIAALTSTMFLMMY